MLRDCLHVFIPLGFFKTDYCSNWVTRWQLPGNWPLAKTVFTPTSIIYRFLWLHPGKSAFIWPLGKRVGLYQEARDRRALQKPRGTYQRELGLCSLLANKLMLLMVNGSYLLTIKSYLLIQVGLAAVLLGGRWVLGMAAPCK